MAKIEKRTFTIRIGNTFEKLLEFKKNDAPIDITGYTFKMQIRKCKSDPTYIYELISPTGIVIADAVNGRIILKINSATTSTFEVQNAVFDLQWVTTAAVTETILEGNVEILETVTK